MYKKVDRTLFSDERIVPIIRVVRITDSSATAVALRSKVEFYISVNIEIEIHVLCS